MGYLEQVSQRVDIRTSLGQTEAIAAARAAIEGIGSVGVMRVRIVDERPNTFWVALKPTIVGALEKQTKFCVRTESVSGTTVVRAEVSDYAVYQQKMFWFIPLGPKRVPGMKVYRRCLDELTGAFKSTLVR